VSLERKEVHTQANDGSSLTNIMLCMIRVAKRLSSYYTVDMAYYKLNQVGRGRITPTSSWPAIRASSDAERSSGS